jgi:ABC-type hemin transport system ATPase subunit
MQINRVRLVNFRQHENTDIELGPGLTGIVGPNGAGKTTIGRRSGAAALRPEPGWKSKSSSPWAPTITALSDR